jgi:hypothetical protein
MIFISIIYSQAILSRDGETSFPSLRAASKSLQLGKLLIGKVSIAKNTHHDRLRSVCPNFSRNTVINKCPPDLRTLDAPVCSYLTPLMFRIEVRLKSDDGFTIQAGCYFPPSQHTTTRMPALPPRSVQSGNRRRSTPVLPEDPL